MFNNQRNQRDLCGLLMTLIIHNSSRLAPIKFWIDHGFFKYTHFWMHDFFNLAIRVVQGSKEEEKEPTN